MLQAHTYTHKRQFMAIESFILIVSGDSPLLVGDFPLLIVGIGDPDVQTRLRLLDEVKLNRRDWRAREVPVIFSIDTNRHLHGRHNNAAHIQTHMASNNVL